jgi:hypothetical protein
MAVPGQTRSLPGICVRLLEICVFLSEHFGPLSIFCELVSACPFQISTLRHKGVSTCAFVTYVFIKLSVCSFELYFLLFPAVWPAWHLLAFLDNSGLSVCPCH